MIQKQRINQIIHQAKGVLSPDSLIIILGPTASGKTELAVQLAKEIDAEIISADSRQVYRHMNIGTGKDLSTYGNMPYHLIDIKEPGEKYNVDLFKIDFFQAYDQILARSKRVILCGGSGSYIQAILQDSPYSQIPKDSALQEELAQYSKEELIEKINQMDVPPDFKIDTASHKRLVRALEILMYLCEHHPPLLPQRTVKHYVAFGLNPPLEQRRESITRRLRQRLQEGLIEEVESLVKNGLSYENLITYGLEYKYVSLHLQGKMDDEEFSEKLNTEIHRYAKRQMTYFRKMEKDGIKIAWL